MLDDQKDSTQCPTKYEKESIAAVKSEQETETDRTNKMDDTNDDLKMLKSMLELSKD